MNRQSNPQPGSRRSSLRLAMVSASLVLAVLQTGCATPQGSQEKAGMVIGGVLGGVVGAQVGDGGGRTAATIIGAMAGMAIGGTVGRSMDDSDRMKVAQALEIAPTGTVTQWRNPDTGLNYRVTPTRTEQTAQGPCREYTVDGMVGGRSEQIVGRACRQADGSWRSVN